MDDNDIIAQLQQLAESLGGTAKEHPPERVGGSFLTTYRSLRLPKEGAYELGRVAYEERTLQETERVNALVRSTFGDRVQGAVTVEYLEKSWVDFYVTLS